MKNELILDNIVKDYDRRVTDKISYTFEPGRLYVIKGVSGCGKSTLFNIIGGVETSFGGTVTYNGRSIKENTDAYRKNVGYIYQSSLLLSGISVMENMLLVKNDRRSVTELAKKLGIVSLLDKTPDELSGGERQRAAVLRCLLSDPHIILADEPTSSLDGGNSRMMAELLSSLKSGRIILVATHEGCFDEYADEILHLDYGKLASVEKFERTPAANTVSAAQKQRKGRGIDLLSFAFKRRRGEFRLRNLFPFALVMMLILVTSTVQNSFEREYIRMTASRTNSDVIAFSDGELELLDDAHRSKMRVYRNYTASEGDVEALYLADKKDSVFAHGDMIEYGRFPEHGGEILVSKEYASLYGGEKIVGGTVTFMGREFRVSGVTSKFASGDAYYREDARDDGTVYIYIPHDTLSEFAEETVCGVTLASYPDLFGDMDTVEYFRLTLDFTPDISGLPPEQAKDIINDISPINDFDYDVKRQKETVNGMTLVLLLVFYICFIIFCIFIRMNVKTELYYRWRELGYLRLFGVEKHRIFALIMLEYASRIMCSCAFALVVYFAAIALYAAFAHSFVFFNIVHVALSMLCAASLYFATVASAIHASMKKSIRELITE